MNTPSPENGELSISYRAFSGKLRAQHFLAALALCGCVLIIMFCLHLSSGDASAIKAELRQLQVTQAQQAIEQQAIHAALKGIMDETKNMTYLLSLPEAQRPLLAMPPGLWSRLRVPEVGQ